MIREENLRQISMKKIAMFTMETYSKLMDDMIFNGSHLNENERLVSVLLLKSIIEEECKGAIGVDSIEVIENFFKKNKINYKGDKNENN